MIITVLITLSLVLILANLAKIRRIELLTVERDELRTFSEHLAERYVHYLGAWLAERDRADAFAVAYGRELVKQIDDDEDLRPTEDDLDLEQLFIESSSDHPVLVVTTAGTVH